MSNRHLSSMASRRRRQRSLVPAPKVSVGIWSALGDRWQRWQRNLRRWRSESSLGSPPTGSFKSSGAQFPNSHPTRPPLQPLTPPPSPWRLTDRPDQPSPDQASPDQIANPPGLRDQTAKDRLDWDQPSKAQISKDQVTRHQINQHQSAQDQVTRHQTVRDQTARNQTVRNQAVRNQTVRNQTVQDQGTWNQVTQDQIPADRASRRRSRRRQRSDSHARTINWQAIFSTAIWSWLDVAALLAWGVLFLKHWQTGKLYLLIHPNYQGLTIVAGFVLLFLAACQAWGILKRRAQTAGPQGDPQHLSLLPKRLSYGLLLTTAILGLLIEPRAFASQTAIQRGVTDTLSSTRVRPQSFRPDQRPEDRSIVDWVRMLNVYPEPDAYTGQKVKVQGFVIHPPELPDQYLLISRFVITCCAADVYPVGLPVKLEQPRSAYPPDAWFEVEGTMMTETIANQRQLTIQATSITAIPEPENPYHY